MFKKLLGIGLAFLLAVGAVFAEEVDAIFKKYDDGKLTATVKVKEKDKENKVQEVEKDVTYEVYAKAKVKFGKKAMDQTATEWLKTVKSGMGMKLFIDEGTVTEISMEKKKK